MITCIATCLVSDTIKYQYFKNINTQEVPNLTVLAYNLVLMCVSVPGSRSQSA